MTAAEYTTTRAGPFPSLARERRSFSWTRKTRGRLARTIDLSLSLLVRPLCFDAQLRETRERLRAAATTAKWYMAVEEPLARFISNDAQGRRTLSARCGSVVSRDRASVQRSLVRK